MIVVKLQGGLGNQMFQYVAARARALKTGDSLRLDTTWFKKSKNRKFELTCFNIPDNILATANERKLLRLPDFFRLQTSDNYYQSERYFKGAENVIRNEFTLRRPLSPKATEWIEKIKDSASVSIHIRRGDYLWEKHKGIFVILPIEYYRRAVETTAQKITDPVLFVFSDDLEWVKENLKLPYPTEFVSDGNISGPEEMYLMSLCKHNIIANSSFSWWSAWLNLNPEKIVVAPKEWFSDKTKDSSDLIPASWKRI